MAVEQGVPSSIFETVQLAGVSKLRELGSDNLRKVTKPIGICSNGEIIAVIVPLKTFVAMHTAAKVNGGGK